MHARLGRVRSLDEVGLGHLDDLEEKLDLVPPPVSSRSAGKGGGVQFSAAVSRNLQ